MALRAAGVSAKCLYSPTPLGWRRLDGERLPGYRPGLDCHDFTGSMALRSIAIDAARRPTGLSTPGAASTATWAFTWNH